LQESLQGIDRFLSGTPISDLGIRQQSGVMQHLLKNARPAGEQNSDLKNAVGAIAARYGTRLSDTESVSSGTDLDRPSSVSWTIPVTRGSGVAGIRRYAA